MALRAGYYGLKKKIVEKVNAIPGIKEIGSGLNLSSNGTLTATGGGAAYAAGTGINISEENVISIDDTVVPDMQDLAGKVGYLDLEYVSGVNYLDISKAEIGVDRFGEADADKARLIIPVGYITQPAESIHFWFMIKGTDTLDAIDLYKNGAYGSPVDLKTESPYECVIAPAWTELIIEFEKTSISMQDLTDLRLMMAPSANIPYYRDFTPNDYILEATKFPRSEQAVLGARNLFFPVAGSNSGLVSTVNSDGSVNVSGQRTSAGANIFSVPAVYLKKGDYRVVLCGGDDLPSGSNLVIYKVSGSWTTLANTVGIGDAVNFSLSDDTTQLAFALKPDGASGANISYSNIKVLITLASDTSTTWVSPAMTNRELTVNKADDMCAAGEHTLYMVATAVTASSGQPEFFIPWTNPNKKTITLGDNFEVYMRKDSAWTKLTWTNAPVINVMQNGFYIGLTLDTPLTAEQVFGFRVQGKIIFS